MIFNKYSLPTTLYGRLLAYGGLVLAVIAIVAAIRIYINSASASISHTPLRTVSIEKIGNFSKNSTILTVSGTLRSKSEADLRFETPGRVTGVYAKVGQWVRAGSIIAEVENSIQRANVTRAYGALQSARAGVSASKAQYDKLQAGTRQEQIRALEAALDDAYAQQTAAQDGARNAVTAAYATANQTILHMTDQLIRNPSSYRPKINFPMNKRELRDKISDERTDIRDILKRHDEAKLTEPEDLAAEIDTLVDELRSIKLYFDDLLTAIDKAILPREIASAYGELVGGARSSIIAQITTLTQARDALARTDNAIAVAKANLEQAQNGAQDEDKSAAQAQVDAAQASVTTALGAYQSALAMLDKTRIRAPISGKLTSLTVKRGDFVGAQSVGHITGPGGSEVVFYIPTSDRERVHKGDTIRVNETLTGHITTVSDSVSAINQQLEVRADLSSPANIPNGSNVSIEVLTENNSNNTATKLIVPINAIKFTADTASVYTVARTTGTTTASALPVHIESVLGKFVHITGGDVTAETTIITDARGLKPGQSVVIK